MSHQVSPYPKPNTKATKPQDLEVLWCSANGYYIKKNQSQQTLEGIACFHNTPGPLHNPRKATLSQWVTHWDEKLRNGIKLMWEEEKGIDQNVWVSLWLFIYHPCDPCSDSLSVIMCSREIVMVHLPCDLLCTLNALVQVKHLEQPLAH